MEDKKQRLAIESFTSGMNCAQSVLKAFSRDFKLEESQALRMASGFGAGMGRIQDTCGAVTGAFMVIGLSNSQGIPLAETNFDLTSKMIQDFESQFKSLNNSTQCKDLIQCDLNTKEGQNYFKDHKVKEQICQKCVSDAVGILEDMIH